MGSTPLCGVFVSYDPPRADLANTRRLAGLLKLIEKRDRKFVLLAKLRNCRSAHGVHPL
jgi:hypothetical protein